MNRRSLFCVLALALVLQSCASASPTALSPTEPATTEPPPPQATSAPVSLKVGVLMFMSNSPLFLADELGFFEQQGLDVELVSFGTNSQEMLPAVLTGQVDIAATSMSAGVLNAVSEGGVLKAVSDKGFVDPNAPCALDAWVARTELLESGTLDDPEVIRGLTMTVLQGSIQEQTADILLERFGLTIEEVPTVVIRDYAARVEALGNGTLDITAMTEPWISRAKKSGAGDVWIPLADLIPNFSLGHIFYGPSLLDRQDDAAVRFMAAYLKGVEQFNLGKTDENVRILAGVTQMEPEEMRAMCWPSFRPGGQIDTDALLQFEEWALARGYLNAIVPPEQIWDPSYIERAQALIEK